MPIFLVEVPIVGASFYDVEAKDADEALELVRGGSVDCTYVDWDTSPHDEDWTVEKCDR